MFPNLPAVAALLLIPLAVLADGGADLQLERSCANHAPTTAACRRF